MADSKRLERLQKEMEDLKLKMREENKRIKEQERKDNQRRKFIVGAICVQHAGINVDFRTKLEKLLRDHVPEGDRHLWPELFGEEGTTEIDETVNLAEVSNDNHRSEDAQRSTASS